MSRPSPFAVTLGLGLLALGAHLATRSVPVHEEIFNGHTYSFVDDSLNWAHAQSACEERGMAVAYIDDRSELWWVHDRIYAEPWANGGNWSWVSGTSLPFQVGGGPLVVQHSPEQQVSKALGAVDPRDKLKVVCESSEVAAR